MSSRLDEAVAHIKTLPEDDQERAASALLAFADERSSFDYTFTDEQFAGIEHAMSQVANGELASDDEVAKVLGQPL